MINIYNLNFFWHLLYTTYERKKNTKKNSTNYIGYSLYRKDDDVPIYTCSSSVHKPITWNEFIEMNKFHGHYWPTIRAIWYSSFWVTGNPFLYAILNLFCHIIPGYLLDTLAVMAGQKPMWVMNNGRKKGVCSRSCNQFWKGSHSILKIFLTSVQI